MALLLWPAHHFQMEENFILNKILLFIFSMYIYITFSHLADAFIQSNLQMRTIEAIKTNKRAVICKWQVFFCYNK